MFILTRANGLYNIMRLGSFLTIFEENSYKCPSSNRQSLKSTRFDYFDGLRGVYMLLVVLRHGQHVFGITCSDYFMLDGVASYISVVGFFMLSAFLLTYRLSKEIHQGLKKLGLSSTIICTEQRSSNDSFCSCIWNSDFMS